MNALQSFYVSCALALVVGAYSTAETKPNVKNVKMVCKNDKVVLRNKTLANRVRTDEVWRALQKIDNSYVLWQACLIARRDTIALFDIKTLNYEMEYLRPLSEKSVQKLNELGITCDGIIDEETQNIIISSYSGNRKIFSKHYPIKRWYESIPGYRISKFLFAGKN